MNRVIFAWLGLAVCALAPRLAGAGEAPSPPPAPAAQELWDRARAAAIGRFERIPPFVAYIMDGTFERMGKVKAFHYRYVLRTRDGRENVVQLPDSPRDKVDGRMHTDDASLVSPFTVFDLRPHRPGERASAFEVRSTPLPEPSPSSAPGLTVIGGVKTVGHTYDVELVGRERLDGAEVWHLRAWPRYDEQHHPIRDLYTRVSDDQPVRIVIQTTATAGPVHSRPSVVVDYRDFGGTWMVHHVSADVQLRLAFIGFGGTLAATIHDVSFPADQPDWMFDGKLLAEHLKAGATPAP